VIRFIFSVGLALALAIPNNLLHKLWADDGVFSGPQVGEKLPGFKVRGILDGDAGKELDFVTQADGKPIVLIFVHEANRPSISMTRILSAYTVSRAKDGLVTGVVWLDDDPTAAENNVKRMKHALTPEAQLGVSLDGREGPGSYGLNRKVILTILVGKAGTVTANFALVQPSIQADLPKILEQVVKLVGGPVPKLEDLPQVAEMARKPEMARQDEKLRELLRPVIRLNAAVEDVDKAAADVEAYVEKQSDARAEVGRIANTIVDSGKLANYGTPRAQEYLKKWAKAYAAKTDAKTDAKPDAKPDEPSQPKAKE
jgi:hypothetical protein